MRMNIMKDNKVSAKDDDLVERDFCQDVGILKGNTARSRSESVRHTSIKKLKDLACVS